MKLVILMTALLAAARAQDEPKDCVKDRTAQIAFAISLGDGGTCGLGVQDAFTTPDTQAFENVCNAECAGAFATWYASPTCIQPEGGFVAGFFELLCLPTNNPDTPIRRCANSFPPVPPSVAEYNNEIYNNSDLSACVGFAADPSQCPAGCAAGLTGIVNGVGCCYQHTFNNTFFIAAGNLTEEEVGFFNLLSNPLLWNTCQVNIPGYCTGNPFPVTAGVVTTEEPEATTEEPEATTEEPEATTEGAERICGVFSILVVGLLLSLSL